MVEGRLDAAFLVCPYFGKHHFFFWVTVRARPTRQTYSIRFDLSNPQIRSIYRVVGLCQNFTGFLSMHERRSVSYTHPLLICTVS